jgi:UDP-N-acetylglucosamine diphosphorylase / glucose-1-phosphate thymidylyltransferase / UDP-N-acetylgalactosamine diphosphorylase / glucosamine-1-phosphate N-acetyltransferase / galactosamine-1-phosphate N-acetyltransferase
MHSVFLFIHVNPIRPSLRGKRLHVYIVEDIGFRNVLPLTATRPVFDLVCGTMTFESRIRHRLASKNVQYILRPELHDVYRERNPRHRIADSIGVDSVCINGRTLLDDRTARVIRSLRRRKKNFCLRSGDDWVAMLTGTDPVNVTPELFGSLPLRTPDGYEDIQADTSVIRYPWDIIDSNGSTIAADFVDRKKRDQKKIRGNVHRTAVLIRRPAIIVGRGSDIGPYVVLDATNGPIIIENDVVVQPHVYISGPAWVNGKSVVKSGARIYGGTSIGHTCKVGGEVNASVILGHSNKAHEGFLGHAYIGEWVNIGAATNNSNLKNDYGSIRVMMNGIPIDTGHQFFGLVMGDHSRTGINTMLNTGTIIGVGCNIFGAQFPPKSIPDFSWGGASFMQPYKFEKFIDSAKAMARRRNVTLSEVEIHLLRLLYEAKQ